MSQTVESDNVKKTGQMIEKSKFEEMYKNRPDILRKAKFFPRRVREGGKYSVKQFTKVYKQEDGVYDFEEVQGQTVVREQMIDDGTHNVAEDQQERIFEQSTAHVFGASSSTRSDLLVSDVSPPLPSQPAAVPGSSAGAAASAASAAGNKRPRENEGASSEDDGLSPLEKSLAGAGKKKKKVDKDKDKVTTTAIVTVAGSQSNSTNLPSHVAQLVNEAGQVLEAFKQTGTLAEVNLEGLTSIVTRLQAKKRSLGKQANKNAEVDKALAAINDLHRKATLIVELIKLLVEAEKKLDRARGKKIEDRLPIAVPHGGWG